MSETVNPVAEQRVFQSERPASKDTRRRDRAAHSTQNMRRWHHVEHGARLTCLAGMSKMGRNGRPREWLASVTKCGDGHEDRFGKDPAQERTLRSLRAMSIAEVRVRAKAEGIQSEREELRFTGLHTLSQHPVLRDQTVDVTGRPDTDSLGWVHSGEARVQKLTVESEAASPGSGERDTGLWTRGFLVLTLDHL